MAHPDPTHDVYRGRIRELRAMRAALTAPAEARQPLVDGRVHDVYLAGLRLANLPEPVANVLGGYTLERECGGTVVITAPTPDAAAVALTVYSSGGTYLWNAAFVDAPASIVGELLARLVTT